MFRKSVLFNVISVTQPEPDKIEDKIEQLPTYRPSRRPNRPKSSPSQQKYPGNYENSYPKSENSKIPYNFKYQVVNDVGSGNFNHEEVSDGDETQGRYDVQTSGFESRTIYSVVPGSGFNSETSYTIFSE
jgi:hypothetical protein